MLKTKKYVLAGVIAVLWLSLSGTALAGIHFAIIADFLNSKNDPANFDVVTPGPGSNVRYTVYQATGNRVQTVPVNNSFATSSDLFNLGGSPVVLPALVSAETVDPIGRPDGFNSTAVLRQKKLILSPPSVSRGGALGMAFNIPLGDLGTGAHMLVGNPFATTATCNYSVNGVAQPAFGVEPGQVKDTPLTTAPAIALNCNLSVVVALALVGKGQEFALTLIPAL